ncbi:MAG: lipopolysaccharide heptosyltransferase II [Desulfococcus multivorans]|jgi:heptosyltransferase-2|nr:lipopolysaccharide heptosyltransferase II [Desulfococcus multivorans]
MNTIAPEDIRRILIRAANWVGDAVMSTPMIRAVRHNFPQAEIHVLAKPWVAPVFENSPDVDQIIPYDARGRHEGFPGILRLCGELRSVGFDLAVLVQNAFEAALIARLAGIPRRLGYATDGRTLLLTHAVPMTRRLKRRHQIDYYLGVLEGAGLRTFGRETSLWVSPAERVRAARILKKAGAIRTDGIIGLNPGAAFGGAKRWPGERFVELGRRIAAHYPALPIAVFGGPGETALGDGIQRDIGGSCINLAGRTTLREAVALIERCRVFITNDSGLMHVADALDIPLVAIFGPTDPTTTSPSGPCSRMVRVPVPCSPCMMPECPIADGLERHGCMQAVTVERVLSEAVPFLGIDEEGGRG